MEHLTAKLRIGGMKGNINRLQVIPCDPLNVVVAHIGQSDIIPLQKRKPGIIIFEVQRLPHAFWHLIDKTEHTFISAGAIFIHQALLEFQAQIFLIILLNLQLRLRDPGHLEGYRFHLGFHQSPASDVLITTPRLEDQRSPLLPVLPVSKRRLC